MPFHRHVIGEQLGGIDEFCADPVQQRTERAQQRMEGFVVLFRPGGVADLHPHPVGAGAKRCTERRADGVQDLIGVAGVRLPIAMSSGEPIAEAAGDGQVEPTAPGGLDAIIDDLERELGSPLADLSRSGKQQAVRLLEEAGAFSYRKSVEAVAAALGVSRFTVYNYLNRERE